MIAQKDTRERSEALLTLLQSKLGVRARTLEKGARKAGRRLPRRVRDELRLLAAAERSAGNPKLARQFDEGAVHRAFEDVRAHLSGIDVADRRRGRVLSIAAAVAFNILVVLTAFVVWLWWRDYV